jgi:phage terminase large subunit-like protein
MREGNSWILDFLAQADKDKVAADGKAGQDLLAEEMKEHKLGKLIKPTVKEVILANTLFEQAVEGGKLCHNGQPSLEEVAANCDKRPIGGGGFGYKSLKPDMEIALLDSVILAYWLAAESKEKKKQEARY